MNLEQVINYINNLKTLNKDVIGIIMTYLAIYIVRYSDGTVSYETTHVIEYDRRKRELLVSIIPTIPDQRFELYNCIFNGCVKLTTLPKYVDCHNYHYDNLFTNCFQLQGMLSWKFSNPRMCEFYKALIGVEPRMALRTLINFGINNPSMRMRIADMIGSSSVEFNLIQLDNYPTTYYNMQMCQQALLEIQNSPAGQIYHALSNGFKISNTGLSRFYMGEPESPIELSNSFAILSYDENKTLESESKSESKSESESESNLERLPEYACYDDNGNMLMPRLIAFDSDSDMFEYV